MERAMHHFSNAIKIPNLMCRGFVCKTNLPSNTAFRGFGAPQAMLVGETIIHHVAESLKMDVNKVLLKFKYSIETILKYLIIIKFKILELNYAIVLTCRLNIMIK